MFFAPLLVNEEYANFVSPPGTWLNCNGNILESAAYPALAAFLGPEYNTGITGGYFALPYCPQFYIKAD
jgi:microcystin-dependent protein